MDIRTDTLKKLQKLTGTWVGKASGYIRSADRNTVAEKLTFEIISRPTVIKYVQKSLKQGNVPTDTECGYLYIQEDGTLHINNAGFSGRVEVLTGRIFLRNNKYAIELASVQHQNDDRIIRTKREILFDNDKLTYKVFIQTRTRDLYQVKEAVLYRD
ncbi:heme-binding beta-barrel domain-containing protein [Dyadobacter sandarakinus]|uniref:FABP family protein n=1 Tax=Dyadobacter sandarakinus TaxID=2747268 RepID=A0ABX7I5H2_9BACT|nr:heme-binding beta-barrel domain-containing protein [Dyadobacter sandarakinus]QRR01125.1 FABP family protein [Dyadobacter sandarakinus]